ncbi:MAG: stage III sporulation protein AE [Roseburia sp.]
MKKFACILFFVICCLKCCIPVYASDEENSYVQDMLQEMELSDLEDYLQEKDVTEDVSFSDLVQQLIRGEIPLDAEEIWNKIAGTLWGELSENKSLLMQVLLLAVCCSFIHNFSDIFRNSHISDICFLFIYMELIMLLLRSFSIMYHLVNETLQELVDFMNMLIPVFCMVLSVGMANMSAAGFYELAFLVIYLVQWLMLMVLVPAVQNYVVMEFINHFVPGEKLQRMCELLEGGVRWCLKFMVAVVVSLNVIQSMVAPAIDRLKVSSVSKTLQMIPGVGNATGVFSEMLLGAGMVMKNCVGVAGIVVLAMILSVPVIKLCLLSVLYKVTAAVTEPISDKRISGCIQGIFTGSVLMQKIIFTAVTLFVITLAMIAASSSFIM